MQRMQRGRQKTMSCGGGQTGGKNTRRAPNPGLFSSAAEPTPPLLRTRVHARVYVCMYVYNVHVRAYSSKGAAVRVRTMHFKRDAWPPAWCIHRMIETDPPGVSNIVVHANVIFEQRSAPGFPAEF